MATRRRDGWRQSSRDLTHARHAVADADHEWAAVAAQQAADKARKAVVIARRGEPWGHLTTGLAEALPEGITAPVTVLDVAWRLDKHDIPARYPNGCADGDPGTLYTQGEAEQALHDATLITEYCGRHVPG